MTRLGVGVVGVGKVGRRHAENIALRIPRARLVAVADAVETTACSVAGELDATRWYTTAEELAADPDVEAVIIATNHVAHLDGILAVAKHRKAIFCEKPITLTLEDADTALAAVHAAGIPLQIGFMRRYDPPYVAAKARVDGGEIGEPIFVRGIHRNKANRRPPDQPNLSSPFVDSAVHDFDLARWFLNDEASAVTAVTRPVSEPRLKDDLALATVEFKRGGLADVEVFHTANYAYDVRTELVGSTGTIFIGSLRETPALIATENGIRFAAVEHWLDRFADAYYLQILDWVRRMLSGEPPAVSGEDGRAAQAIAVAATTAAETGQKVLLP
jgi:scyllo-inositol 2-dehydrogenase (NAD+)